MLMVYNTLVNSFNRDLKKMLKNIFYYAIKWLMFRVYDLQLKII